MGGKIFYLMRKNEVLTAVKFSDSGKMIGFSRDFSEKAQELLPLAYRSMPNEFLYKWWDDRSIPLTRDQIYAFLSNAGYSTPAQYLIKNLGLSLTDYYWIKDINSSVQWKDVNLYENEFHENILLSVPDSKEPMSYSPNSSLQGNIEKTWTIINGERCLIKGNHSGLSCESINEVIACEIHKRQGYDNYTHYDLLHIKGKPYQYGCVSKAFTSLDKELVSAWAICTSRKKEDNRSYYEHFIDVCGQHGADTDLLRRDLEYQILADYILTGYDRHLNNISMIRDSESLKFIRMAPIYDSGDCLFANREFPRNTKELEKIETSSFRKKETDMLKLVTDPNVIDLTKLPPASYIQKMYEKDRKISREYIKTICEWYEKKIDMCRKFQLSRLGTY